MWTFIQEQILGMKWLNVLIGNLLNTLGLDTTEKIGCSRRSTTDGFAEQNGRDAEQSGLIL